ncbi:Mitochondrial carrier domain [Phytophthora cactorum]|nr:Mitochondrial carrier domain [Phytophthora cactorum]
MPVWGPFVSGSLSGFTASIITYPLDLIRTRVSGQIGAIWFIEGPRALFRGIGPTLFGALPYEGIKFGSYDILTGLLPEDIDHKASFAVLATIFTYPNDTVRRRLQMQGAGGAARQYKSAWDCYVKLAKERRLDTMPNMGVQFATYDFLKGLID